MKKALPLALLAICVCVVVGFLILSPKDNAQTAATNALAALFTCTQEDVTSFNSAKEEAALPANQDAGIAAGDDQAIVAWLNQQYPDMLAERGMQNLMQNRSFALPLRLCEIHQMDFNVTNITLQATTENAFTYALTLVGTDREYPVTGTIEMQEENDIWKVSALTTGAI